MLPLSSQTTEWRFIPLFNAPGSIQMALDTWLLHQHRLGLHPPTLRFYTWSPIAISLGYHQKKFPSEWQNLTWNGQSIDLVRRPSGGRAVLHQGDLTYAVITSGLANNRMAAYQQICQFLIEGWRSLQVELHYGTARSGYMQNPNCFDTSTIADLVTTNGNKLIGSAQLRQGDAILQHGSMRLEPDQDLFRMVFGIDAGAYTTSLQQLQEELEKKNQRETGENSEKQVETPIIHTRVETEAEPAGSFIEPLMETLIETLKESARTCFNANFVTQPLTESEWYILEELAHQLDNPVNR